MTGDAALCLPKQDEQTDPVSGDVLVPADPAGVAHLIQKLKEAFEIHDQDRQGEHLDAFWDTRRGAGGLQDYLLKFKQRYRRPSRKRVFR